MSIASSQPLETRRLPPFYGPDDRYVPPTDDGVALPDPLPGHMELPDENDEIVENFRETPQNSLLDQAIWPTLERLHPDRHFAIGHDCGIYWKLTKPLEKGAVCPDWFYVPGVPPDLDGHYRRSYVLWKEHVKPAVLIEYSSEDGTKERDRTPFEGKFWIYERAIQGAYYAIFVVETGELEVHKLLRGKYRRLAPNQRGHFQIEPLGVNLGVWRGLFYNETAPWLRWYDDDGNLLPLSDERAELAQRNAEQERRIAEQERRNAHVQQQRAEQLEAKLRELGIDPATVGRDSTLDSEQS
jgi:Uma2 family endonuclease